MLFQDCQARYSLQTSILPLQSLYFVNFMINSYSREFASKTLEQSRTSIMITYAFPYNSLELRHTNLNLRLLIVSIDMYME